MLIAILNENVQVVKINRWTVLTPSQVGYALQRAYGDKMYAKFTTGKYFIQVNFARDGNISVSSNIRHKGFLQDLWKKNQLGWTMSSAKAFVYQWMQVSRRVLH